MKCALVLLVLGLAVAVSGQRQRYPDDRYPNDYPNGRPVGVGHSGVVAGGQGSRPGSGIDCRYRCQLNQCGRERCHYKCSRPYSCEDGAKATQYSAGSLDQTFEQSAEEKFPVKSGDKVGDVAPLISAQDDRLLAPSPVEPPSEIPAFVKPVQDFIKPVAKPVESFVKPVQESFKPVETFVKPVEAAFARPAEAFAKPVETFVKPVQESFKPLETVKPFIPFPAKVAQDQVVQEAKKDKPAKAMLQDAATPAVKVPIPESKPDFVAEPVKVVPTPVSEVEPKPEASEPEPIIFKAPVQKEEVPQTVLVPIPQQVKFVDVPKTEVAKAEIAKAEGEFAKAEVTKVDDVKVKVAKVAEVAKPEIFTSETVKEEVVKKTEVVPEVKKEEVKKFDKPLGV